MCGGFRTLQALLFRAPTAVDEGMTGCARRNVALRVLDDMESAIGERLGQEELATLRRALLRAWP